MVEVLKSAVLELPVGEAGAETGQTVVESTIVSVVRWPLSGQFGTDGGQEVTV
jgi:hypothetical protein